MNVDKVVLEDAEDHLKRFLDLPIPPNLKEDTALLYRALDDIQFVLKPGPYQPEAPTFDTESVVKYTGPFISTWKQGHLKVLYSHLVRTFGPPHETENLDKTDAEWTFMTPAGVATIYNYKNGVAYNGIGGTPIKGIREWNIGGTNGDVVSYIKDVIF